MLQPIRERQNKRGKMEDSSSSLPSLLCQEDHSCLNEYEGKMGNPLLNSPILSCFDLEYEDDYIKLMVQKEKIQINIPNYPSWLWDARLDAINWIFNAQTMLGFRNRTAYLSVTYLDRFISIRYIDEGQLWAIKLLSIACLSLAAKMEEYRVPAFSEYPIDEDYGFGFKVIQKMELLVLSTMGWKMSLITPFCYIHYFIKVFGYKGTRLDELISRAMELIMLLIKEINLIDHRPSVIAAAAVLAATDWQLTQETMRCKISTVVLWQTSENELFTCYRLMQRLSPNGDPSTPNFTEVDKKLSCATTSILGAKRRLIFSDCDQNPNLPEKIRRP